MAIETRSGGRRDVAWLAGIYVGSLCLPALYSQGGSGMVGMGQTTFWGIMCLGFIPFVMVVPPWWANPLFFAGLVCLATGRHKFALILGCAASLLALSMIYMMHDDLWPTSPAREPFFPFGPGYFLWVGSMLGLAGAAVRRIVQTPRVPTAPAQRNSL